MLLAPIRFARRRLLPLAALLLSTGCAAAASRGSAPAPLQVLVYNIHAGKDVAGVHNLERVADAVRTSGADLVLLQEVDRRTERSGREDQLATLERLTGMHGAYGRTIDYQGGEYGIAVLSRWPILADTLHPLRVAPPPEPTGRPYEERGALHAVVDAPGGRMHVVTTHLDASSNDFFRLQQVSGVRELARRLERTGERVLVGGDFNAVPESPVIARMLTDGWRDAWTVCGSGPGFTSPVEVPRRRIDYLILPPQLRCEQARVLDTLASDHRAVLFRVSAP